LGYLIAAYAIVIVSLVVYALWIHNQRRKLRERGERDPNDSGRP
jgi:CcmD family protein